MTKQKTKKAIIKEIDKLNIKIDLLIIQGLPYKHLSAKHYKLFKSL